MGISGTVGFVVDVGGGVVGVCMGKVLVWGVSGDSSRYRVDAKTLRHFLDGDSRQRGVGGRCKGGPMW